MHRHCASLSTTLSYVVVRTVVVVVRAVALVSAAADSNVSNMVVGACGSSVHLCVT